jgi:hypothetical protein
VTRQISIIFNGVLKKQTKHVEGFDYDELIKRLSRLITRTNELTDRPIHIEGIPDENLTILETGHGFRKMGHI